MSARSLENKSRWIEVSLVVRPGTPSMEPNFNDQRRQIAIPEKKINRSHHA